MKSTKHEKHEFGWAQLNFSFSMKSIINIRLIESVPTTHL